MREWLQSNLGTLLISLFLLAAVALIVRNLIRRKKRGGGSCGCNCPDCSMCGSCPAPRKKT